MRGGGGGISGDDLFHYVYGVLHLSRYRKRFAANLAKELPRIPVPKDPAHFWALADAGKQLGDLHVGYENAEPWPIEFAKGGWQPEADIAPMSWFRVGKPMKHPARARNKDLSQIIYNPHIMVANVPTEAYEYVVNGKAAIAWVMLRQCVTRHRKSGIINDANQYASETMQDSAYPLQLLARVIRVSMDTLRIVKTLPEPEWQ